MGKVTINPRIGGGAAVPSAATETIAKLSTSTLRMENVQLLS